METALIDALHAADACVAGAVVLAEIRPDPAAVLALLDGAERYINQARAALATGKEVQP